MESDEKRLRIPGMESDEQRLRIPGMESDEQRLGSPGIDSNEERLWISGIESDNGRLRFLGIESDEQRLRIPRTEGGLGNLSIGTKQHAVLYSISCKCTDTHDLYLFMPLHAINIGQYRKGCNLPYTSYWYVCLNLPDVPFCVINYLLVVILCILQRSF